MWGKAKLLVGKLVCFLRGHRFSTTVFDREGRGVLFRFDQCRVCSKSYDEYMDEILADI